MNNLHMDNTTNPSVMSEEELYEEWRELFNKYRNGPQPVPQSTRARFADVSNALRNFGFFGGPQRKFTNPA